jgi:hypothetical protein
VAAARGYATPLERLIDEDARRDRSEIDAASWSAAVPAALQPLVPLMLETSKSGLISADLLDEVSQKLGQAFPDPVLRTRALLSWHAAGTGRVSGLPIHESIPGELLSRELVETVRAALRDEPSGSRAWEGALRHLAGWHSRSKADLAELSTAEWITLVATAEQLADGDKLQRIKRMRPVDPEPGSTREE